MKDSDDEFDINEEIEEIEEFEESDEDPEVVFIEEEEEEDGSDMEDEDDLAEIFVLAKKQKTSSGVVKNGTVSSGGVFIKFNECTGPQTDAFQYTESW